DDLTKLRFSFVLEFADGHMERIVTGRISFRLALPELVTFPCIIVARRATHFNKCGGASYQRRNASRFVRILSEGRHERQINMDVRIYEARENDLSGRIENLSLGRSVQVFADSGDRLVLDIDVATESGIGGDNFAILDQ